MWVPFEEPCFLKYVASKEDPLPQQLSWVGGERKEESHLAPDNAISTQGRFLPTDVNPQLQSQLQAYDHNHKNEMELLEHGTPEHRTLEQHGSQHHEPALQHHSQGLG